MRTLAHRAIGLAVFGALALAVPIALPRRAGAAVVVPVQASIKGLAGAQTIGSISADGGFAGNGDAGSGLRADFTLANKFAFLDNRYDFDWVNVVTKQDYGTGADGSGPTSLFPNPPNIDPIPQEDDNLPFYYNSGEWTKNSFGGVQIHSERAYSRFLDIPNQPADRKFFFLTFLVLRDNGAYTLDGKTQFNVLAGFSWQYQGAAGDFDHNRGTSTPVGPVSINQDVIDILNGAMSSSGTKLDDLTVSQKFTGWNASTGAVLVPEPASALLLFAGMCVLRRRSRRSA